MKVASAESHVVGSYGLQESKGFAIRTSAHAFKLLSSGMYKDKPAAVLREIGCNAVDAHIQQGTPDLPIEVKLPNRIDKQFYIKDWGPGLSHDDIMNMYTSYFTSTKQTSNDFTGAFGLGSKSPFSYTDAFVVTSVHGGKKRTYSAHLGEDETPTIALLTTEDADADWEHGLMVGFPVKPTDYQEFQTKAQVIFKWFRVPPRVEGAAGIVPVEKTFDGADFMRIKGADGAYVLMGGVCYPLAKYNLTGLSELGQKMFDFGGIVIKAAIGDVLVTPSREDLQYDKASIAALSKRCEDVAMFIANDAASVAKAFETAPWAYKCKAAGMDSVWSPSSYYRWDHLFTAAKLPDAVAMATALRNRTLPLPTYAGSKTAFRVLTVGTNGVRHSPVTDGLGPKNKYGDQEHIVLSLIPETKLYWGQAPHALARARQAVIEGKVKQLILVVSSTQKGGDEKDVSREAKKLLADFHGMESDDIANLPVPAGHAAKGTGGGKKKLKKGAALPPLPSQMERGLDSNGSDVSMDVATPGAAYMVLIPHHTVRLLDTTVDKDRQWHLQDWRRMLVNVNTLRDELGLSYTKPHLLLAVARVKAYDLQKRGNPRAYDQIRDWLADQATRDDVAAVAGKWKPTIPLGSMSTYGLSWVEFFVNMRHSDDALFQQVKAELTYPGLVKAIDDTYVSSKAAGKNAGMKTPAVLDAYNRAVANFDVPVLTGAAGKRSYLDITDLNNQMVTAHPLFRMFSPAHALSVANEGPGKLVSFLKFLHS